MVTIKQTPLFTVIKLSPNQSASWRETKIVITIMVLLVMSIAIGWTMAGAWIILPFAGLEVGLFAYFMYRNLPPRLYSTNYYNNRRTGY